MLLVRILGVLGVLRTFFAQLIPPILKVYFFDLHRIYTAQGGHSSIVQISLFRLLAIQRSWSASPQSYVFERAHVAIRPMLSPSRKHFGRTEMSIEDQHRHVVSKSFSGLL